jgi:NAD(P)-dependent dehydrogenase (short-subunit alcohol dehydrogenase family)
VRARGEQERWWLLLIEGILGVLAGLVAFFWPGLTALALLYFIAAWAIVTASKHGVMGLTQALHAEGKEHGVRVMAVVAGGMRTNFFRTLDLPPPLENLPPPENVAACILFMVCQPEESVIQELIVTPMTETSYP